MAIQYLSGRKKRVIAFFCFGLFLVFNFLFSFSLRSNLFGRQHFFFIPKAQTFYFFNTSLKTVSADFFYLKAMFVLSEPDILLATRIKLAQDYFSLALQLDPKLKRALFFGGLVTAIDRASTFRAINFLLKNIYLFPQDWRIYYWVGFNYYTLGDYVKARQFYQKAAGLPQAPYFLISNQPMLYYRQGNYQLGIDFLQGLVASAENPRQKQQLAIKLAWLKGLLFLEQAVDKYFKIYQVYPERLDDLVTRKIIKALPPDNFGQGYYWDVLAKRVKSQLP